MMVLEMDKLENDVVESDNITLSKKKKILTIIAFVLTTIFMILFLISVFLKKEVLVYIFMFLFIASAIFEMVMCIIVIIYAFKKYVGKSNAF